MKINGQLLEELYWDDEEGYDFLPRIKGIPQKRGAERPGNLPRHPRKINLNFMSSLIIYANTISLTKPPAMKSGGCLIR